uniref:Uncharacterized protein n=1 Tax=Ascaris lumbricoides TaxID=6252 RepID=A0A0M3HN44_ASCLU
MADQICVTQREGRNSFHITLMGTTFQLFYSAHNVKM